MQGREGVNVYCGRGISITLARHDCLLAEWKELVDGVAVIACEVEMAVGQIAWPSFIAGVGLVPTWRR